MNAITERREQIGGVEVLWRDAEPRTAAPALYLHGVPTSGRDWEPFLARTGGIAPDLPGFGRSDKSAAFDYSIPGYTRFLMAFVDALGIDRLQLVVHDWGAVGLALAQERPELVERLVVMNCVPLLPGYRWHAMARVWRTPLVGELSMGSSTRRASRALLRRIGAVPADRARELVDSYWPHLDHGTQRAILRLYRSAPPDVLEQAGRRLRDVGCPALVLWGRRDPFIAPEFAQRYADALGGDATVEMLDDAAHWIWLERPDVVDRVAGFLTDG